MEKRKGSIMLFTLNQSDNTMQLIRTIHTPAILDMKWSHHKVQDKILFATVNAIGQLIVYELMCSAGEIHDIDEKVYPLHFLRGLEISLQKQW